MKTCTCRFTFYLFYERRSIQGGSCMYLVPVWETETLSRLTTFRYYKNKRTSPSPPLPHSLFHILSYLLLVTQLPNSVRFSKRSFCGIIFHLIISFLPDLQICTRKIVELYNQCSGTVNILVQIRFGIRIRGSVALTNRSGSGSFRQ
jgi:hypothetical protein